MVVHEFFANATKCTSGYMVFVKLKQVKYDVATINQLLHLLYNPSGPDKVEYLMNLANMEEVSSEICKSRGYLVDHHEGDEHAHFPSKDLQ